jgi:putative ABC transport system permease protein
MLLFATATTGVVGLLAGLVPVLRVARIDVSTALREGASGSGLRGSGNHLRNALVVCEMAMTLVLAFSAGLLLRSLIAAQGVNTGFDSSHLLALDLQLPKGRYRTDAQVRQYYGSLLENLRREPGIESVGAVGAPPTTGEFGDYWYSVNGRPAPARSDVPLAMFDVADSQYFATMRIHLFAGRAFAEADRDGTIPIAIINETLARRWWDSPGKALGEQIKWGGPYGEGPSYRIVGVVADTPQFGLDMRHPEPEFFFPFSQKPTEEMVVMMRTIGEPYQAADGVRRQVAALDANVPIKRLLPFTRWMGASLDARRFSAGLLTLFAILALLLAMVGIYGVMNYWVSVRQKEIAVRVALGASQPAIVRWMGTHAFRLTVAAVSIGAAGAWASSRWMESMVFGVAAQDPATIALAAVLLCAMAWAACAGPLLRAMHVDPARYLHQG